MHAGPPNAKAASSRALGALVKLEVSFEGWDWGATLSPDPADKLAHLLVQSAREARAAQSNRSTG